MDAVEIYRQNCIEHAKRVTQGTHIATYEIKEVCGRQLAYPINDRAHTFQNLIGHKTLQPHKIELIESLGFTVVTIHGETIQPSMIG